MRFRSDILSVISGIEHGFGAAGVPVEEHVSDGVIVHRTHQVHGNAVHVLEGRKHDGVIVGDAFITAESGVVCCVRTADCVPILVADPIKRIVGAVHAGWRGTAADVAGAAVAAMSDQFGCEPGDIRAAIGPAICGGCYEVGDEVIRALGEDCVCDGHVDLAAINRDRLIRVGLTPHNIDVLGLCTACGAAPLASYRRDKTEVRQSSFILLHR